MADGRKNNGGKRAGSGRKSKAEEVGLAALLDECWTVEDRKTCLRSLATLANSGDMDAVKLLMAYTFGKPKESVEHSADPDAPFRVVVEYVNDWRSQS